MTDLYSKISIIIPVYNDCEYVRRCLESVINQTYRNIEILITDDGSDDGSGTVCDEFAARDERVRVWHTEHKGVSAARNLGLDNITGEYVCFVDSDDYVDEAYVEILYKKMTDDVDMVISYETGVSVDGRIEYQSKIESDMTINIDACYDYRTIYRKNTVWSNLYRTKLVKDLRFDTDLFACEDSLFQSKALKRCRRVRLIRENVYYYVFHDISAYRGPIDDKKYTEINAWNKIIALYPRGSFTYKTCCAYYLARCFRLINRLEAEDRYNSVYFKKIRREIRRYSRYIGLVNGNINMRMAILLVGYFPQLYKLYYRLKGKMK